MFPDPLLEALSGVAFQPVVDLRTGLAVGYEALCRPAADLAGPAVLFREAVRADRAVAADRAACRAAVRAFRGGGLLFLNLTVPSFLAGPGVLRGIASCPGRTVVEVTEHGPEASACEVVLAASAWRREGYLIAADDVVPGTARFGALAAAAPEFVKVARGVVAEAAGSLRAVRVLAEVTARAARWGGRMVAEGIETAEELERVRSAGIGLGQGYLLGGPAAA